MGWEHVLPFGGYEPRGYPHHRHHILHLPRNTALAVDCVFRFGHLPSRLNQHKGSY